MTKTQSKIGPVTYTLYAIRHVLVSDTYVLRYRLLKAVSNSNLSLRLALIEGFLLVVVDDAIDE